LGEPSSKPSTHDLIGQEVSVPRAVPTAVILGLLACLAAADSGKHGPPARVPWKTSRITGSPEPPPPYRAERVFAALTFKNPIVLEALPKSDRLVVVELAGKIFSFPGDPKCARADLFLDMNAELQSWDRNKIKGVGNVYGLTFHPQFAKNRYVYICYVLDSKTWGEQLSDGSRVSRFRVTDTNPPRIDPKSEKVIITWFAGGHNGGCLQFGNDGMLYISTGDGSSPNPPDALDTGQNLTDLLSCVLRIDVDKEEKGKAYAVPPDNPFVHTAGARAEIWAYGFRNPWRMSVDRRTGDLWVGDVGWELWEMIYRVQKGGNYGWSVMEGRQAVRPDRKRGPTPILPPTLDFPHSEAASITGGYVYHGKRLPDLDGSYVCGDWVTGKMWGTRFDGDRVVSHRELAQTNLHIVSFGEDHAGELYFLSYDDAGGVWRLVPNEEASRPHTRFPQKLSETGLFAGIKAHQPAPGVVPFSIRAAQWADHADAERFVALPDTSTARVYDRPTSNPGEFFSGRVFFPKDGVLAKTFTLEMERGNPRSRRRLETQILHSDGTNWHGYSYRWNDEQTDADLVPATGADRALTIIDRQAPGGKWQQTWHYPGRAECLQCHNPWVGGVIAFTPAQLDCDGDAGSLPGNQLRALEGVGIITPAKAPGYDDDPPAPLRLVDPHDHRAGLDDRARSYLHVNCSHCHQFGAGGSVDIDLRGDLSLEDTKTLQRRPVQGTFDIPDAEILAPGDPYRSVLYYRMAKIGRGRMPHIGSEIVDDCGVGLMHEWIRRLPIRKDERAVLDRLCSLDEPAIVAREKQDTPRRQRRLARWIAQAAGRDTPTDADRKEAEIRDRKDIADATRNRVKERADAIQQLLSTTTSALMLARALQEDRIPASIRPQVLSAAMSRPDSQVRDLFERFVPDEQRIRRLGNIIRAEQILSLKGDPARGRELFLRSGSLCINCHKLGNTGGNVGPDLSQIGKKLTRAQVLESILEPSKTIDPAYVAYVAETTDGKLLTGLLVRRTAAEVVLRDAEGKESRIPAAKLSVLVPQKKSLMPDLLLRDLSAEQAADLVDFLASLK
jgi:putative heme-binding domain-containing protein